MAERQTEIETFDVSLQDLESELRILIKGIEQVKNQLRNAFHDFHDVLLQREKELLEELDAIPASLEAKIMERRDSLKQLQRHRDATETELQTNTLNEFLTSQLENVKLEIDKISTETITFPFISLKLDRERFWTGLHESCRIEKCTKRYTCSRPVWSGVKSGKGEIELDAPYGICIDPVTQLLYIAELSDTGRIQIFTENGRYHSTIHNEILNNSRSIKLHKDYIFISSGMKIFENTKLLKLNQKGELIKSVPFENQIFGMAIEGDRIYTTASGKTTVLIHDLNLKYKNKIELKAKSFDANDTIPSDVIVRGEEMFVLFMYRHTNHPDPIQVFRLDGTLIRSIQTGGVIKEATKFYIDCYQNFIVSDWISHCIRIFSEDGTLFHIIGDEIVEKGPLCLPRGVAVTARGKIVVVNLKDDNILQIF